MEAAMAEVGGIDGTDRLLEELAEVLPISDDVFTPVLAITGDERAVTLEPIDVDTIRMYIANKSAYYCIEKKFVIAGMKLLEWVPPSNVTIYYLCPKEGREKAYSECYKCRFDRFAKKIKYCTDLLLIKIVNGRISDINWENDSVLLKYGKIQLKQDNYDPLAPK